MNIHLIAVGKLKEEYLRSACAEYIKRLGRYCALRVCEVDDYRLSDAPSEKEISAALEKEALAIKKHIRGAVIPLCIEGELTDSRKFSEKITSAAVRGVSDISFVIGSSYGLSPKIKEMGSFRLSMSPMTFPHQLARVMLLEQIYRAFQIAEGGKYHK